MVDNTIRLFLEQGNILPYYITPDNREEILNFLYKRGNIEYRRPVSNEHYNNKKIANNLYWQIHHTQTPLSFGKPYLPKTPDLNLGVQQLVNDINIAISDDELSRTDIDVIEYYNQQVKDIIYNRLDPEKKFIPVITTPVINEQPSVLKYNSIEEVPDYDPLPRAFDIDDTPYPDMLDRGEITQEQYDAIENSYRARLKEFHNNELAKWNYIASISYGDEPTSDLDETLKEYVSNTEGNNVPSSEISSKQILDDIDEAIGVIPDNTSTSIPTKSIDNTIINQLIDKHTMTPKKIAMVAIPSVLGAYLLSRDNNKQSNQQYRY